MVTVAIVVVAMITLIVTKVTVAMMTYVICDIAFCMNYMNLISLKLAEA